MFEDMRSQAENVGDEDEEAGERKLEWEWGEIVREANNESNLAERGF